MAGTALQRHQAQLMAKLYPVFSRRATQVCILSSAMEKIAAGCDNPQAVARAALEQANPFGWLERNQSPTEPHT